MKKKINIIIEYVWLVTSILAIIGGIHKTYNKGLNQSWLFFAIAVIALLMFFFRRYLRKKEVVSDNK
jgi:predicted RND superfamily exporter protein